MPSATGRLSPLSMRLLVDIILFLSWISIYLSLTYGIGWYRRTQAFSLGTHGRGEFRAEKDPGVRLAVFLVGILLGVAAYFVLRALGRTP
jgi:hypothetical protein